MGLESSLAQRYFESALAERYEVRKAYVEIKRRHPEWNLEGTVLCLIKMVDSFEQERITREWNRLIQGKTEPIMKFFERYLLPSSFSRISLTRTSYRVSRSFQSRCRSR